MYLIYNHIIKILKFYNNIKYIYILFEINELKCDWIKNSLDSVLTFNEYYFFYKLSIKKKKNFFLLFNLDLEHINFF